MTKLIHPRKLESYAVIIRCTWANGADDQRDALNELYRRGLWLGEDQVIQAIMSAGLALPETTEERNALLAEMGYCSAPLPEEYRDRLPVIFRVDRHGDFKGVVTAVFPSEVERAGYYTCYSHVGQHSTCVRHWVTDFTRPATPEEYAPLLAELRGIYETGDDAVKLEVKKRATWA